MIGVQKRDELGLLPPREGPTGRKCSPMLQRGRSNHGLGEMAQAMKARGLRYKAQPVNAV
jgi:hypothetical protein